MRNFSPHLRDTQLDGTTIGNEELSRGVRRQLTKVADVDGGYERVSLEINGELATENTPAKCLGRYGCILCFQEALACSAKRDL
jgi:hypothetical protein